MSWLPDWLTGFDRENYERGKAADAQNRQLTEELLEQGRIGQFEYKQAMAHYDAADAEDPDAEIDSAFNEELNDRTAAVRNFASGGINAIFKSVFGTIPWQVWIGVGLYVAWRLGLLKGIFGKFSR